MTPRMHHLPWIIGIAIFSMIALITVYALYNASDMQPRGFYECRLMKGIPITESYPIRLIACIKRDAIIEMETP